jgi:hypothetical protein
MALSSARKDLEFGFISDPLGVVALDKAKASAVSFRSRRRDAGFSQISYRLSVRRGRKSLGCGHDLPVRLRRCNSTQSVKAGKPLLECCRPPGWNRERYAICLA